MLPQRARVDRVFHALGDPTRRAIVEKLSTGAVSVSSLAKPLDITLAAVVQHLQVLEKSGLVRTTKVGRVRAHWERRLDRLGTLLEGGEP